ncbi:unnamed protein product [Brugia pahangi]|uniref:Secreted protein n=1 Tax=Brugia pahangi TaxID=6280 RepID=A0A0N4TL29_BRUPA|nr:unnamed protein product [Brugia pahangi]
MRRCSLFSLLTRDIAYFTESARSLLRVNADECKHWITGIFYFEWSNSSVTLASNKINSRFDRLLPDYLRDTVEWITKCATYTCNIIFYIVLFTPLTDISKVLLAVNLCE